jgi:hypothetical protein
VEEHPINGFCMLAKTQTWWANAYDAEANQVFCPRNDFNSKSERNPLLARPPRKCRRSSAMSLPVE